MPSISETLRNRQLCFAHLVYLQTILFAVESGLGSRGSSITLDPAGTNAHPKLDARWKFAPETTAFREKVLETEVTPAGQTTCQWVPRRPIPESDVWFETAWAAYRNGEIYQV